MLECIICNLERQFSAYQFREVFNLSFRSSCLRTVVKFVAP